MAVSLVMNGIIFSVLFNIMNNSKFSCSHFSQISDPWAMSKRQMQEGTRGGEDERVVAKSRPSRNLVSMTSNWSEQIVQFWIHWERWNLSRWIRMRTAHQVLQSATQILSRTQARWNLLRDRERAPSLEVWSQTVWPSPHSIGYMDKVFASVRQKLGRPTESESTPTLWRGEDSWLWQWTHRCISEKLWRTFTCDEQHRILRDSAFVVHHAQIDPWSTGWIIWSEHDWDQTPLMQSTLFHEHAIKLSTAKIYAFSDSVLRFAGRIAEYPLSVKTWSGLLTLFLIANWTGLMEKQSCSSGRFSQGTPRWRSPSVKFKTMMENELNFLPKDFKDRIIFMSVYNDIERIQKD